MDKLTRLLFLGVAAPLVFLLAIEFKDKQESVDILCVGETQINISVEDANDFVLEKPYIKYRKKNTEVYYTGDCVITKEIIL